MLLFGSILGCCVYEKPHILLRKFSFNLIQVPLCFIPCLRTRMSSIFIWGYYGTQYRVKLYPPFGYSILYNDYNLTGFNHQKKRHSSGNPLRPVSRYIVCRGPSRAAMLVRGGSCRSLNKRQCNPLTMLYVSGLITLRYIPKPRLYSNYLGPHCV